MQSNTFKFVKDVVLNRMPSGMLVTKSPVDFDIGCWQHKYYSHNIDVRSSMLRMRCSNTVNILEFDESSTVDTISTFILANRYETIGRYAFNVNCIILYKNIVNDTIRNIMSGNKLLVDRFSTEISIDNYSVFINDFIKSILYI
jgi:hypothetical protein